METNRLKKRWIMVRERQRGKNEKTIKVDTVTHEKVRKEHGQCTYSPCEEFIFNSYNSEV